jgi:hypothetical protein
MGKAILKVIIHEKKPFLGLSGQYHILPRELVSGLIANIPYASLSTSKLTVITLSFIAFRLFAYMQIQKGSPCRSKSSRGVFWFIPQS